MRRRAHEAFDALWIKAPVNRRSVLRRQLYIWLAGQLALSSDQCHFKKFTADQCDHVIRLVKTRTRKTA